MSNTTEPRQAGQHARAAKFQKSIAAVVECPLCPMITAEAGLEILTKSLGPQGTHQWRNGSKTTQQRAAQLVGDTAWRERALGWIDGYREAHGHGPSWRRFWYERSLWPADATITLQNVVMRELGCGGYLDGMKTPFGLRRRTAE